MLAFFETACNAISHPLKLFVCLVCISHGHDSPDKLEDAVPAESSYSQHGNLNEAGVISVTAVMLRGIHEAYTD